MMDILVVSRLGRCVKEMRRASLVSINLGRILIENVEEVTYLSRLHSEGFVPMTLSASAFEVCLPEKFEVFIATCAL